MKVEGIYFDDNRLPEIVDVEMTIQEVIFIARLFGKMCGYGVHSTMYDVLTGMVFNPYWEEGVDGAVEDLAMDVPPPVESPSLQERKDAKRLEDVRQWAEGRLNFLKPKMEEEFPNKQVAGAFREICQILSLIDNGFTDGPVEGACD